MYIICSIGLAEHSGHNCFCLQANFSSCYSLLSINVGGCSLNHCLNWTLISVWPWGLLEIHNGKVVRALTMASSSSYAFPRGFPSRFFLHFNAPPCTGTSLIAANVPVLHNHLYHYHHHPFGILNTISSVHGELKANNQLNANNQLWVVFESKRSPMNSRLSDIQT